MLVWILIRATKILGEKSIKLWIRSGELTQAEGKRLVLECYVSVTGSVWFISICRLMVDGNVQIGDRVHVAERGVHYFRKGIEGRE